MIWQSGFGTLGLVSSWQGHVSDLQIVGVCFSPLSRMMSDRLPPGCRDVAHQQGVLLPVFYWRWAWFCWEILAEAPFFLKLRPTVGQPLWIQQESSLNWMWRSGCSSVKTRVVVPGRLKCSEWGALFSLKDNRVMLSGIKGLNAPVARLQEVKSVPTVINEKEKMEQMSRRSFALWLNVGR